MLSKQPKKRVVKSGDEALSSLMRLCARAERSSGDALRLMHTWGVDPAEQSRVLERLLKERFIDDRRYVDAFIREKTSLSAWGEYKIKAALQRKGISSQIISSAMADCEALKDGNRLREKLRYKLRNTKYETLYQLKGKLVRYAASLGYAMDDCIEAVEDIMTQIDKR